MIETVGLPIHSLIENAGRAVSEFIHLYAKPDTRWLILAGKGNNGADGFAAARHLVEAGLSVDVLLADTLEQLGADAAVQYNITTNLGIPCMTYDSTTIDWHAYDGIVDALLGTGSRGKPKEHYAAIIQHANESKLPIIAVDIPSGIDPDTGQVHEAHIRAKHTVCLAFLKRGLVQMPGAAAAGEVHLRSIGLPAALIAQSGLPLQTQLLTPAVLAESLGIRVDAKRASDSHKGTYGRALIAAGTLRMSGAGLLCTRAALRSGCGLATWAVPASLAPHLLGALPEAMIVGLADAGHGDWAEVSADTLLGHVSGADAFAIGPGMGRYADDTQWLRAIWEGTACPIVIDADALNMMAESQSFAAWDTRQAATVLTPHPGEMARLTGMTVAEVQRDRLSIAQRYAMEHQVTLVLKGACTIIAAPDGALYINQTGNAGMATGGSGDALTGIIVSLLAQGLSGPQAACLGVYQHGVAGDRAAAKRHTAASLIAQDIIEEL